MLFQLHLWLIDYNTVGRMEEPEHPGRFKGNTIFSCPLLFASWRTEPFRTEIPLIVFAMVALLKIKISCGLNGAENMVLNHRHIPLHCVEREFPRPGMKCERPRVAGLLLCLWNSDKHGRMRQQNGGS